VKSFADAITIGRLLRPQGRKGELLVEPLSDQPERFASLGKVLVEAPEGGVQELRVTDCWPHKGRFVLKFDGVDSIDAAEKLRGRNLGLAEAELQPLPQGSYYHHQLVGLRAQDRAGHPLGRVERVLETGAVPVLQIAGDSGELLLPLAETFIVAVDLAGGTLTAVVPETVGGGAR
jgi:16S rRNA processing protein RimM